MSVGRVREFSMCGMSRSTFDKRLRGHDPLHPPWGNIPTDATSHADALSDVCAGTCSSSDETAQAGDARSIRHRYRRALAATFEPLT